MQNSIYIYAYDSQKPLYFLEEKINLFKPIQVVWRYTWKAEIVSTRPSITWRASWTRYPYFIWCFSDPVALWGIVAYQINCTAPYSSPNIHVLTSMNCTSYSIGGGPNHLCIMCAHGAETSHRTSGIAILGIWKGIVFHFVIPWLDQLENRAVSSSSYR